MAVATRFKGLTWPKQTFAVFLAAGLLAVTGASKPGFTGAEPAIFLVMFDEPGCEFCALWDAEVGLVCTKTPEGQFAPLRRFLRGTGPFASLHGVVYTPTFVVVRGSNELGRITGYPGEDFFWAMLGDILAKAGFRLEPADAVQLPAPG